MSFVISYKSGYEDVSVFYPYEGWDEESEYDDDDDRSLRDVIRQLIQSRDDQERFNELVEKVFDKEYDYFDGEATAVDAWGDFTIDLQGKDFIRIKATDLWGELDSPSVAELIPDPISKEFCIVKVWENSGHWRYEGEGDFDRSQIRYEKGRVFYGDEEFDFTDGDGCSSYIEVYKDGALDE